jgi:7-carboxy-7-deazaguanine synthase
MRISHIFLSIQGEGIFSGVPMIFLRTQGCNLAEDYGGCRWCDTRYAQDTEGGEEGTVEEITDALSQYPSKRVCITGGEPLWQPEIGALLATLKGRGYWVEAETNGSIPIADHLSHADSWVVDVKCPSSGMEKYTCLANLAVLRESDQVKFVVQEPGDIIYAEQMIGTLSTRAAILFSPVHGDPEWLRAVAEHVKRCPEARLSVQLHKFIWGDDRHEGSSPALRRTGLSHGGRCGQESGV